MDHNDNTTTDTIVYQKLGNLTSAQLDALKWRDDNRPINFAVDNMENLIGNEIKQEQEKLSDTKSATQMIQNLDKPIINGIACTTFDGKQGGRATDLRLETVKNKTTWQQMSPRRERKLSRQNSSGSSGSGGSASGGSNCNSVGSNSIGSNSSTSPTGSPTKSWKSIKESNKNDLLSWKDLSPTKIVRQNQNEGESTTTGESVTDDNAKSLSPTKKFAAANENQLDNKHQCSPDHKTCSETNSLSDPQRSPEKCKGLVNRNELNKQLSPEHAKHRDLCRNTSGATDDGFNNEYFYDEDFTVQFDTNLRESSPGLNCTCVDPDMVMDFPHMITGSYLSFNDMKGSSVVQPTNSQELFCPDESELSSCRNSAMDMSSSEREMMCSSDMLDFSDNPIFTPSPTRDLNGQNVSTDSLDKKISNGHAPGCQNNSMELSTSRTSSDGNLCVNCCPRKEEYFLSFDGSQGRSGTNSDNDNSLTSLGSGQGHWVQGSSGEDIAEECSDSFHFCNMMHGNQNLIPPQNHKKKRFQSLKAVQENSLEECDYSEEDSRNASPSPRLDSKITMRNRTVCTGKVCSASLPSRTNSSGGSLSRSRKPSKNVTSWKQVKTLKKLGKRDPDFDPTRSHSMPELYYEAWHSFSSQDCRDLAKIAESFHGKRHSAYLLDLYQRVRNQSNPVSPETMANIEQILFQPLISRCQAEVNLSGPETKCCAVCGHKKDDSHSSHTLTNSNVQQLVNSSRNGQALDYYTKKRILEWLERDKIEGHLRSTSCQTGKDKKSTETVISPTTVTLWCGTKNFGSQFPPCTKDCGIQAEVDADPKDKPINVEQQTSATIDNRDEKADLSDFGQQTSPVIDKHEILSLLPDNFKDLDEIMPKGSPEKCPKSERPIPRSRSADPRLMKHQTDKNTGSASYYSFKSLPELNFLSPRSDFERAEQLSLFDPLPVQMPIPVFIPATDLTKSKESIMGKVNQASGHKSRQAAVSGNGKSYKRSKSAPSKLSNPQLMKHIGESASSSSGFSTSSTSSGIDPGYSSESRAHQNSSPSNDIERLLFFPPHIELSSKTKKEEVKQPKIPKLIPQGQAQHPKLTRLSERKVSKYANEAYPNSTDLKVNVKMTTNSVNQPMTGKSVSDSNLQIEHLGALQEENTPVSSPDQHCHHRCCQGQDCFYAFNRPAYSIELGKNYFEGYENEQVILRRKVDYLCQVSSESGSSTSSGCVPKADKKPLKSCLRKKQILRSRSLSDQFNLAQQGETQNQRRKMNRHSYACEEVYLLTDESGQYYLCQSDNMSQGEESEPEPTVFRTDNIDAKAPEQQTVKLRRKRSQESAGSNDTEKDNLSGKRKSVSFASEVSFHAISPQMSPKNHGTAIDCDGEDHEVDVESIEDDCAGSADEHHSDESDAPPQEFKLSPPPIEEDTYDEKFSELEKKKVMLVEVCQAAELLVNHFNKAKNPFDKLRLGSSADCEEVGDIVLRKLCPAVSQVVADGLKPHLTGFQMFGRVQVNVWKVAELSAEQGPYTRAIHDLVQQLKSNPSLLSSNTKFEAFLFGLLNLRLLDYWMGYLRYNCSVTEKFYNVDGVIVLGKSCHERAYDEMLIALQPLAVLPFQLGTEYVIQHSEFQHRSPSHSPIKNKPSPGVSPTVEKPSIVSNLAYASNVEDKLCNVPPPKPARLERPTHGLVSTKAWEWLKGGANSKTVEAVKEKEEGKTENLKDKELFIDEDKLKEKDLPENINMKGSSNNITSKATVSMTESFSGLAQKLLGISSPKDRSSTKAEEGTAVPNVTNNATQMEEHQTTEAPKQLSQQSSFEAVSTKARTSLIRLFDKLLLSKETSQVQNPVESSESKKSSSWNFGFAQTQQPEKFKSMIPTSKSLSPVNNKGKGISETSQDSKGLRIPTKARLENVVAKSIQNEAKKSSKVSDIKQQQTVIKSLLSKEKEQAKKEEKVQNVQKVISQPAKISKKKPDATSKNASEKAQQNVKKSDKTKISKIPTLKSSPTTSAVKRREKSGSRIPKRHSLVLDSSGSEMGSPNSSALSSPVKVRHSRSAEMGLGTPSPSKNFPSCNTIVNKETVTESGDGKNRAFKSVESAGIRNSIELVKHVQKSSKQPSTEKPEMNTRSSGESSESDKVMKDNNSFTSSNEQCASLELGPTLVAPPSIRDSFEKAKETLQKPSPVKAADDPRSSTNVSKPLPQLDMQNTNVELDINSNSPLSLDAGTNVFDNEGKQSSGKSENRNNCAKQEESGDLSKPNFRYIETLQSFESSEPSQLSYRKGEHYEVLAEIDSSWFYCVNGGREGLIHTEAAKPLTDRDEFNMLHGSFYS